MTGKRCLSSGKTEPEASFYGDVIRESNMSLRRSVIGRQRAKGRLKSRIPIHR